MKKEIGITLVSLVITIVILLILSTTMIISVNTGQEYKEYKKMCADIEILRDRIAIYYNKYVDIPTVGDSIAPSNFPETIETGNFYEIDLSKLPSLTLNFGTKEDSNDMYIINMNSFNVYYLKGLEYNGNICYREQ